MTANDHPYQIIVSTNPQKSHLVDMKVVDVTTSETIQTFTAVESHFDEEGRMISSIDNKTLKSNVVLHDDDIVVFDEVRRLFRKSRRT